MAAQERKRIVVLGCVLGLVVAFFIGKTLLNSNDTNTASTNATNPFVPILNATSTTAPRHVTRTTKEPTAATTTPPTFQVYGTKNPFEPVIQVESPTNPTSNPTSTTPSTKPSGTTTTTTRPTTTTTPSNNPAAGQTVTLIDVFRDKAGNVKAHMQVGSTVYVVGVGTTFAHGTYRVVSLDPPCGQFLYGDAPFRLCQGEQTLK